MRKRESQFLYLPVCTSQSNYLAPFPCKRTTPPINQKEEAKMIDTISHRCSCHFINNSYCQGKYNNRNAPRRKTYKEKSNVAKLYTVQKQDGIDQRHLEHTTDRHRTAVARRRTRRASSLPGWRQEGPGGTPIKTQGCQLQRR